MLSNNELEQLKFFADKVANVHGDKHREYISVNEIVKNIKEEEVDNNDLINLRKLTNNYIIPEGACKAQTTLLNLLNKLDNN